MEHYLLCILNSSLSEDDHRLTKKYLQTLFPSPFQCRHIRRFHEPVSNLLKPVSKYIAILNASEANENILWKLINEDANIIDILEDEVTRTDSALGFDSQDAVDYICESLHSLADLLPAFGTYKLDILLGSDVLRELSVRKEPSLAGVFIRLTRWHGAHFTIFKQQEFDVDRLNEWCEIINGQIFHSDSKYNLGPPLWQGSIQFASSENKKEIYKGFQLKLDTDENHDSTSSTFELDASYPSERIVVSSKLELVDEVSFVSIPPYLITPVTFRLHLNQLHVLNANSSDFFGYLLSNRKVAFVAKLGYSELKERSKSERKYFSRAWEKVACTGEVKDSECFMSSFESFITFVITKSNYSDYIVAYPLRDAASLDTNFYFTLINHRICNAHHFILDDKTKTDAPSDNDSKHKNILHKYLKCNLDFKNNYCDCKNIDFSFLNENNQNSLTCFSSKFAMEQFDPFDWPERIQLLQKQMKNEGKRDVFSANASMVHNLRLPHQSYSLSSQSIAEHFLPSGEGKNLENCQNINLNSKFQYLMNCNLDDILQLKWPDVMNCTYHDLFYNNSDRMEDKENLGSQLVSLYVQHETACLCNHQQINQNFQITVSERVLSPSKAFRGPSSRLTIASNEREMSPSPRKNNLKELITKKILSISQVKNCDDTQKASKRNNVRKCITPVRCSPRKKNPVNYKSSSVTKNNENKNGEFNKMTDLLRKKLRCAVAKALEDNGINGNHKLYQPCGAKLLTICRTFLDDLKLKKGKTSEYLQKIADAHAKQVIEFYKDS